LHPDCRALPDLAEECLRGQRAASSAWRAKWIPALRTARWLERKAAETGLPFEVRPDWFPPCIDWAEFRQTLSQFEERVVLVANRFGAPHEVRAGEYAYGNEAPDLIATWHLSPPPWEQRKHLEMRVRVLQPADVKQRTRAKSDAMRTDAAIRKADVEALARIAKRAGCTSHQVSEVKRG
jgi:hypothetical protein